MRRYALVCRLGQILFLLGFCLLSCFGQDFRLDNTPTSVYFSPNGGAANAVINQIRQARREILVEAYSFTSIPIAKALVEARARQVSVILLLDKSTAKGKSKLMGALSKRGIQVFVDDNHAIAHNKVMIIDRTTLITGSFNFTKAAEESNAENLLIIQNDKLCDAYLRNFVEHKGHSIQYVGR